MSEAIGSQINFRGLLRRHGRIRIPMIQRDYAQGRPDEREVREGFLAALEDALKLPAGNPALPLNLDFIYGSVEGPKDDTRFSPLDGQQRLTTLFLLHWFLAWQDGAWDEFGKMFRGKDGHSCFTYKVRQFSNEFFDKLVAFEPAKRPQATLSIRWLITDQRWYFRNWRLDPTIQSALTMLDAIHQRFKGSKGLFERLTNEEQPAITFQLLDLENFGLSDDLYIKMNARGKPLTAFETFKAVLALITRDPESKEYLRDLALLRDDVRLASYATFQSQGWLEEDFTETLIALLEQWADRIRGKDILQPLLPDTRYFDEATIFAKIADASTNLTLTEITQFAGYVLFIRKYPAAIATDAFQEWMRVVRNLALNTLIERPDDLRSAARGLAIFSPRRPMFWRISSKFRKKRASRDSSRSRSRKSGSKPGSFGNTPSGAH